MALKKELSTSRSLQPLVAQYVPLLIGFEGSGDFGKWLGKYQAEGGNAIPQVFVIRADGEKLYGRSGHPESLPQFLQAGLTQAGRILSGQQLEKLTDALEQAKQHQTDGDLAKAVLALAPAVGTGSYAEAAIEADTLAKTFTDEGLAKTKEAADKVATAPLQGAIELVEIRRVYGRLPDVVRAAGESIREHSRDAELRNLFSAAEGIDRAQSAASDGDTKRAVIYYKQVVSKFADTPASKLALDRLAELDKEAAAEAASAAESASSSTAESSTPAETEYDERKASSYLKLATTFAENRPKKARDYAQRALKLVSPTSEMAAQAQALLDRLK